MRCSYSRTLVLWSALTLGACATAPDVVRPDGPELGEWSVLKADRHARIAQQLDLSALQSAGSIALPDTQIVDGLQTPMLSAEQIALVSNRAARELCHRLAPYYRIDSSASADLSVTLNLVGIAPTGKGAAGVSAALGFFVPGPFRLPAGLGGLAMDAVVQSRDGTSVLAWRWSRGANAVTDSAQWSSIGDAYQLAGQFAGEMAQVMIDPQGRQGPRRARMDPIDVRPGRALCRARFGAANSAGRGASWVLPLAPEAYDDGEPPSAESAPTPTEPEQ